MPGPASAYAALGLEPGADHAAVERAYRDLIKRYHPDRSGGDAARAAEINRAYCEIRGQPEEVRPVQNFTADRVATRPSPRRRSRRHSRLWPLVLAAILVLAIVQRGWLATEVPRWSESLDDVLAPPVPGRRTAVPLNSAALDGPLAETAIARSIEQAIGMAERGEEQALADRSRACHRRMRSNPDLEQLDRCAAFDDAVAAFGDRDPMSDAGAFSASSITARQMTAASLLSDDFLAIERRLDRIRMVVQLTLRPQQAAEPPVPPQDGEGATDALQSNEI
jgi:hypothetical protein